MAVVLKLNQPLERWERDQIVHLIYADSYLVKHYITIGVIYSVEQAYGEYYMYILHLRSYRTNDAILITKSWGSSHVVKTTITPKTPCGETVTCKHIHFILFFGITLRFDFR